MKLKIQSIKDYFKSKKDKGLKPVFFKKIGDQNTSRDEMKKNLSLELEPCVSHRKQNWWSHSCVVAVTVAVCCSCVVAVVVLIVM